MPSAAAIAINPPSAVETAPPRAVCRDGSGWVCVADIVSFSLCALRRAMLDNAVVALKVNEATALAAFNDKSNTKFHDRDLYVFCYDRTDGKFTAHANPAMMSTDVRTLKAKDDPLGQRIFDTINKSSGGSVLTVDYNFPKPGTTEPVPKQSFVTKVGNQGCGVGYYK